MLRPNAFDAVTENVYSVPEVRPSTVIGEALPDAVMLPGVLVTTYSVIANPPVSCGGTKLISTEGTINPQYVKVALLRRLLASPAQYPVTYSELPHRVMFDLLI